MTGQPISQQSRRCSRRAALAQRPRRNDHYARLAAERQRVGWIRCDYINTVPKNTDEIARAYAVIGLRERTQIREPLLERLDALRLISQRSVYPHIDIDACTATEKRSA